MKSDTEPQTSGLWMSKPYVVEQSNGNKVAVLLVNTQGVFNEYSTRTDWSAIVGISLLISSCIIFNIFNGLKEETLMSLESSLQYSLFAAKDNLKSEEKLFKNLVSI